ncbi:hypothetical protein V8G54_009182 [Vigna mungo]|uniref:Uncharacterized protein n=1 Tax=Vigna mungo TaxID=3915 RepID=A0AAQ3NTZ9_VIGMU
MTYVLCLVAIHFALFDIHNIHKKKFNYQIIIIIIIINVIIIKNPNWKVVKLQLRTVAASVDQTALATHATANESLANTINKKEYKARWVPKIQILKLFDVLDDRVETPSIRPGKWLLTIHNRKRVFIPKLHGSELGSNHQNKEIERQNQKLRKKKNLREIMADQPKEVITVKEVFSNERRASTLPSSMDKGIGIYVEHFIDLKEVRIHDFIETIAKATKCPKVDNCFSDNWDLIDLTPHAKILQHVCSKTFLHKNSARDHITKLGRFSIYHMMIGIPFNLPHLININLMGCIRGMNGYNFWTYYPCLISRIMKHQGIMNRLMSTSPSTLVRNAILVNGAVRGHKFNTGNLKQMKLEVKKLNKASPLETKRIVTERQNKATPPHQNIEQKKELSMKCFKTGFSEVDRGLKNREALRVYQGQRLIKEHEEHVIVAQHSPTSSIETMIIKLPQPEHSTKEEEKRVKLLSIERQNLEEESNSNDGLVIEES